MHYSRRVRCIPGYGWTDILHHQTIQGCGSRYRTRPVVNEPATIQFGRDRSVWIHGGGRTYDRYNIYVLVPDSTTCTADEICPADIQHVISLRLGPADNLGSILPREDLHLSLCENSLRPTLIADRRIYWAEVTPLLQRWQSVNNTGCPHCHCVIWVNMSRQPVLLALSGFHLSHVV